MKKIRDLLLPYSRLFKIILLGTILFTIYRFSFLIYNHAAIPENTDDTAWLYFRSLTYGLNFDLVVLCYFVAPYLLLLFVSHILNKSFPLLSNFFKWYFVILLIVSLLICCADIPYYEQFGTHFNKQFSLWMDSPGIVLGLIFSNFFYLSAALIFIFGSILISRIIFRIFHQNQEQVTTSKWKSVLVFLFLGLFTFIGMRGRTAAKSPIRIGTAFFSEHYFFNQLGLNPCFVFAKSMSEHNTQWTFLEEQKETSFPDKEYTFTEPPRKHNVVIVLMESMAISKMGYYGCKNLTPRFHSLISKGLFFDRFFSAGIHTFNGVFSTETGFPAVMDVHPLNSYNKKKFHGISWWLKQNGYSNYFFTSHDPQFDNLEGFMKFNDFDKVYSQVDHPADKAISTLGVPDHYLLGYALEKMNEHVKEKKEPFFSYILTSSDHTPWEIPEDVPFKATAEDKAERATQYADWALGNFMENAKKQTWFENTVFIFVADHGMNWGHTYAMPLSYHHIPCLFYMPSQLKSDTISNLGGQIDIFPTLMSFLKIPFKNTSMGIDLMNEQRPFMYFSADTKIGCIGPEYYYIHLLDENKELLYKYKDLGTHSYLDEMKDKADSMRNYSHEMISKTNRIITTLKY